MEEKSSVVGGSGWRMRGRVEDMEEKVEDGGKNSAHGGSRPGGREEDKKENFPKYFMQLSL